MPPSNALTGPRPARAHGLRAGHGFFILTQANFESEIHHVILTLAGDVDLVLHFRTQDTTLRALYEQLLADDINEDGILDSTRQLADVSLTGQTVDGVFFAGFDQLDLFLSGRTLRKMLDELAAAGRI